MKNKLWNLYYVSMANTKRPTTKFSKDEFYVEPAKLKQEIEDFYVSNVCSNTLGEYLNKIAKGLSYSPSFINYTYKDEMIGDALVKMYAALKHKKYNVKSDTNPFSYFTTIAFHAFINRIKREKKHHQTIESFRDSQYAQLLTSGADGSGYIYSKPTTSDDDSDRYYDESE